MIRSTSVGNNSRSTEASAEPAVAIILEMPGVVPAVKKPLIMPALSVCDDIQSSPEPGGSIEKSTSCPEPTVFPYSSYSLANTVQVSSPFAASAGADVDKSIVKGSPATKSTNTVSAIPVHQSPTVAPIFTRPSAKPEKSIAIASPLSLE